MSFFDRFERRAGWLAFPGFLRYYALLHVLVFVLQFVRPEIGQLLEFNRAKILSGEVWRLATMFFANSQFGGPGLLSIIFLYFAIMIIFLVSDSLENAWGAFKTSIFYYVGILSIIAANFVLPFAIPFSGLMLYLSAFLAFCTLFPRVEFLMFMIVPVQVRYLGMFAAAGLVFQAIKAPPLLLFFAMALLNYVIWVGIPVWKGTVRVIESSKRRSRFNAGKVPENDAFHSCVKCDRTDASDPDLEFRIGVDGKEYCAEHLPD